MVSNKYKLSTQSQLFDTMEQAMNALSQQVKAGDMVMLSPACASLDQFSSFEKRGEEFTLIGEHWDEEWNF